MAHLVIVVQECIGDDWNWRKLLKTYPGRCEIYSDLAEAMLAEDENARWIRDLCKDRDENIDGEDCSPAADEDRATYDEEIAVYARVLLNV